ARLGCSRFAADDDRPGTRARDRLDAFVHAHAARDSGVGGSLAAFTLLAARARPFASAFGAPRGERAATWKRRGRGLRLPDFARAPSRNARLRLTVEQL